MLEEVKQRRQQTENDMWTELEQCITSGDSEKEEIWVYECQNLVDGIKQQYNGGEHGERLR